MTSGSNVFLLDTNVLVYACDQTDGAKRARAAAIIELVGGRLQGAITPQVMGEFYVTVTRKIPSPLSPLEAEEALVDYSAVFDVLDLSASIVLEAVRGVRRHRISYWDALIWAAAKDNHVPVILTEDMQHGQILDGVRFQDPFHAEFDLALLD